jgi:glucosylceramidase
VRKALMRSASSGVVLWLVALVVGCGGGGSSVPPGDFSVSVSPGSAIALVGNTTPVVLISINPKNGFAGTVNITLQGIPQGVAAMPAETFTIGVGATGSVAFAISDSASAGTSQITILATSGQLSHSALCSLTAEAPPPVAATPSFWPLAGTYSPTQITLSDSTPSATIFYTTDGSEPKIFSRRYAGPIAITSTTTIKALAYAPGHLVSQVASGTYVVPMQNGTGPTVSIALTTDDQSRKMEPQGTTNFTMAKAAGNVIYVDETETYQPIEGFGAAFTDSAAYLLNEIATSGVRSSTMNDLFTRNGNGIGLSFMRTPMAASDLARSQYSYDDNNGVADPALANFSIVHDQADVIPVILQAQRLNPRMKLMANPWSPPAWMKTNASMVGGGLQTGMYGPWSQYFVKYLQAYAAAGVNVDYISVQNEPTWLTTDYPGMCLPALPGDTACQQTWPTDETTAIRDYLLPALAGSGLNSKVLVMDNSWCLSSYATSVMSDPTIQSSAQVAGTAWHGYCGTPGVMTAVNAAFSTKGNYETEHSGFVSNSDQVKLDFEEVTHVMRSWGRAYVKWSLALDENSGPHTGGCTNCTPIVTVNSTSGAVSYGIEYYTMGHFSKFVLPGAVRIYSSNADGMVSAAFLNADGSKALVVFNDSGSTQDFQVQWGNQSFAYVLPSYAGATFTWTGSQTGSYVVSATSQIQASSFDSTGGTAVPGDITTFGLQTEPTSDSNGGYDVGSSSDGDYAVFRYVDFGAGLSSVDARMACNPGNGNCGGTLEFHLDSLTGAVIASVLVPSTATWQSFITVSAPVSSVADIHDLYVVFRAPASGTSLLGNWNWFRFH